MPALCASSPSPVVVRGTESGRRASLPDARSPSCRAGKATRMASRSSRVAALFLGVAVALAPRAGPAAAAPSPGAASAAAPRTVRADDAAAGWLARQFVDGNHLETSF